MGRLINSVLLALCVYCISRVVSNLSKRASYSRLRKAMGCKEALRYPHKDPLFGSDHMSAQKKAHEDGTIFSLWQKHFASYGRTHEINLFGQRLIHSMEPQNFQAVLATNSDDFGLQPLREGTLLPLLDKGTSTTDGEYWRFSRSLIRPTFARAEIANFDLLQRHVDRFLALIPRDGSSIDLQPLCSRLILDTLTEFLFGESTDFLSTEIPQESEQFIASYNYVMMGFGYRVRLGKRFAFLHRDKKWLEAVRVVHEYVDRFIDNAIKQLQSKTAESSVTSPELGKRYILLTEMARQIQDKEELRSQVLSIFLPGFDASVFAMSNVFHILARRPDVWDKLRKEIASLGSKSLSFEGIKSLKYLQWVLNESHRIYPVTAQIPRVCLKTSVLPTGGGEDGQSPILLQKGDIFYGNLYALHHDRDIWGDDVTEFRPERWEHTRPFWNFLPFGGGARICPAQQLVLTESAYTVVRVLQEFERIESRDEHPWTPKKTLAFMSKYGVKVALFPG